MAEEIKINLQKLFSKKDNQFMITNYIITILSNALSLIAILLLTTIRTINLRNIFFLIFDDAQQESNYIIY